VRFAQLVALVACQSVLELAAVELVLLQPQAQRLAADAELRRDLRIE
jgi:hypothetical protein